MPTYDYPYVRDEVTLGETFRSFYTRYQGPGAVVVLARIVRLAVDLKVDKWPVILIADLFDGNGHTIDARGTSSGVVARPGTDGAFAGYINGGVRDGWPAGPGGDGTAGGNGGAGTAGRSVTLLCREAKGVRIKTSGGSGTSGAHGGNGAPGSNGFYRDAWVETIQDPRDPTVSREVYHEAEDVYGTSGGSGGWGGKGGNGGNGGSIRFLRMKEDAPPLLEAAGGRPGSGAPGGSKAAPGARGEDLAADGNAGEDGTWGADGAVTSDWIADDVAFSRLIRPTIGDNFSNHWAPFRVAMGDYFYHRHNPKLDGPSTGTDHAAMAAIEFVRALELQPDNTLALRLLHQLAGGQARQPVDRMAGVSTDINPWQVTNDFGATTDIIPWKVGDELGATARADPIIPWLVSDELGATPGHGPWMGGGNNAVGLPRHLDIVPQFDAYQGPYNAAVLQQLSFLGMGLQALMASANLDGLRTLAAMNLAEAGAARDNIAGEVPIAEDERSYAGMDADYLRKQVEQASADIVAATAEMQKAFDLGDVAGTVAEIGGAIVGVIGAIPTGGASLVGLVPALVTLSDEVLTGAAPIVQAVLSGTESDTKAIEDAYDKVDKKASEVIKSGKTIVNFITLLQKLAQGTTTDNAKQVALVRHGAELAHELMMAEQRAALSQQRLDATKAKLARAEAVVAQGNNLGTIGATADALKAVGQLAIATARSRTDATARFAFWAQRSIEIYTLKDESQNVHLDAGQISPEIDRQYYEGEITEAALVAELIRAWGKLLDPIRLQQDYLDYFSLQHDRDTLRLSFKGAQELESLRTRRRFSFSIDPADTTSIPANRFDAKIRSIRLALVGATHPNGEITCEVRHGALYGQRRRDGSIARQYLEPRIATRPAKLEPLAADEGLGEDPPLTAPRSLAFWGRGIGGTWELSIPDNQFNGQLDVSGVTMVQLWIGYQFVR